MSAFERFLPLEKIDLDTRLVHGVVTAEQPDRAGEICDYDSTKPYFEAWSKQASDVTGGKSLGAVRAMHGKVAAGKLTDIAFDDGGKRILVAAKIVDDDEWRKVQEGVYTGFSQGGRYVKRWPDGDPGLTRYTAEPTEISLVDLPCLPGATFDVVKGENVEKRAFAAAAPVEKAVEAPVAAETAAPAPAGLGTTAPPAPEKAPNPIKAMAKAAKALKVAARKLGRVGGADSELRKGLDALRPELAALAKRLAALEARPLPARAALRALPRSVDGSREDEAGGTEGALKRLAALSPEERALALTKLSLANPLPQRF